MEPTKTQPAPVPPAAGPETPPATALQAPDIVSNIPVHSQAAPAPAPNQDDDDLDKIMQDVGHELKKADKKPAKKHMFGFSHKPKNQPKFQAQPMSQKTPAPAPPPPQPQHSSPQPQPPAAAPLAKEQPKPTAPKPKKSGTKPVFVALLAVIVAGALAAVAFYTYKGN